MKKPFIQLKGRNKKRLEEKLILYNNDIYKYRNNQLIFVKQNDGKTTYHYKLANKETNKFYPITPAKLKSIRKTKTTESSAQDKFYEFVDTLKKHPHLTSLRNGITWSEEDQKLLLNTSKNCKAFKIMVDNDDYLRTFYDSLPKFREACIRELDLLYRSHDVKKLFVDTKTFLVYNREGSDLGVTTVKDVRRGSDGFERILLNQQDIERYVDDYLQMVDTYMINSDYVNKAKDNSSIYQFDNVLKVQFTAVKLLAKYGGKLSFKLPTYLNHTISNLQIADGDQRCFYWSLLYAMNRKYNVIKIADRDFVMSKWKRYYNNDLPYFNGHTLYEIDKKIYNYPVDIDNITLYKEIEDYLNINLQIILCDITKDKFDSCQVYYNGSNPKADLIQLMCIQNPNNPEEYHYVPVVSESNLKNLLNALYNR